MMVEVRTAQVPVQTPGVPGPVVAVEQSAPVVEAAPVVPVVRKMARPVVRPVRQVEAAPAVASDNGSDNGGAHEIRIESSDEPDVVILLIGG